MTQKPPPIPMRCIMDLIMRLMLLVTICVGIGMMINGCSTVAPGNDPLVVRAEQTTTVAFRVIDTYLRYEYEHRETLPREAREFARQLRRHAPDAIRTARALTRAYKLHRTPKNRATMLTAVASLDELLADSQRYLAMKK